MRVGDDTWNMLVRYTDCMCALDAARSPVNKYCIFSKTSDDLFGKPCNWYCDQFKFKLEEQGVDAIMYQNGATPYNGTLMFTKRGK